MPSLAQIHALYQRDGLDYDQIVDANNQPTDIGMRLIAYFQFRSNILVNHIAPNLMKLHEAKDLFFKMKARQPFKCPFPMNKQKNEKKDFAFLTGIVNMLIETNCSNLPCNYNPAELTSIVQNGFPLRVLSRRVDGAFPNTMNPIAIWEIKEYYYTTTFGSRVADGVYETLLDGMELQEIRRHLGVDIEHYLIIDDYFTWWVKGRSYLCRLVDMLHMGILTQVIFGREVVDSLPGIVSGWVDKYSAQVLPVTP